jgi:hypothetical protein
MPIRRPAWSESQPNNGPEKRLRNPTQNQKRPATASLKEAALLHQRRDDEGGVDHVGESEQEVDQAEPDEDPATRGGIGFRWRLHGGDAIQRRLSVDALPDLLWVVA